MDHSGYFSHPLALSSAIIIFRTIYTTVLGLGLEVAVHSVRISRGPESFLRIGTTT